MNDEHRKHASAVADAIEAHAGRYHQGAYTHRCGTPSCVAGWSVAVKARGREGAAYVRVYESTPRDEDGARMGAVEAAVQNLGLRGRQAVTMFDGSPYKGDPACRRGERSAGATAADAVAMLRRYARTGRVFWS